MQQHLKIIRFVGGFSAKVCGICSPKNVLEALFHAEILNIT